MVWSYPASSHGGLNSNAGTRHQRLNYNIITDPSLFLCLIIFLWGKPVGLKFDQTHVIPPS